MSHIIASASLPDIDVNQFIAAYVPENTGLSAAETLSMAKAATDAAAAELISDLELAGLR